MELTVPSLQRLLTRCGGSGAGAGELSAGALVAAARRQRLLPTLVSAWTAAELPVSRALLDGLREHRERAQRYEVVETLVREEAAVPVRVRKGRTIGLHYPVGWFRASADLDLEVDGTEEAIAAVSALRRRGWRVAKVLVFRASGRPNLAVDLTPEPVPGGSRLRDLVQIQGFAYLGAPGSVGPLSRCAELDRLTPAERALVDVVAATAHRGIRGRDVLDRYVLRAAAGASAVSAAVNRLQLATQWWALDQAAARVWPAAASAAGATDAAGARPVGAPVRVARVRHDRLRQLRAAPAAELFEAGQVLSGVPDPTSALSPTFGTTVDGAGVVRFHGPFGAGVLVPKMPDDHATGWAV